MFWRSRCFYPLSRAEFPAIIRIMTGPEGPVFFRGGARQGLLLAACISATKSRWIAFSWAPISAMERWDSWDI